LLVVITIVAILMGLGVPSFKYVTVSNRMSAEVNGLLGDMQLARAEAIKEGSSVTVCSSTDGANCSGSTDWSVVGLSSRIQPTSALSTLAAVGTVRRAADRHGAAFLDGFRARQLHVAEQAIHLCGHAVRNRHVLEGRHTQTHEDGDDRYDDQQLSQSEPAEAFMLSPFPRRRDLRVGNADWGA